MNNLNNKGYEMKYGDRPAIVDVIKIDCKEMMFYQYLPIKMKDELSLQSEPRLKCFNKLIIASSKDFIKTFGIERFKSSFIYLTAKRMYQLPCSSFNRLGWHSDGFLTDDINYIWCDDFPTVFNDSKFNLTLDDKVSLLEMSEQALPENDFSYDEFTLLRLNQFNIHKVGEYRSEGMRTFFKLSFSEDKYNL